jgi:hypothetical protein
VFCFLLALVVSDEKSLCFKPGTVDHAYNPSYSRGEIKRMVIKPHHNKYREDYYGPSWPWAKM